MKATGYRVTLTALAWALLASLAFGQEFAPNRESDIKYVAERCPGLVRQDHAFTDAAASYLAAKYPGEGWGRNAKRGNTNDPSHDAIWYPNPQSPIGGAVIDIIVAAGRVDAAPGWLDQTMATVTGNTTGGYIRPSGVLPPCLTGGNTSNPPPSGPITPVPPITPPAPPVNLQPILDALARLQADVDALKGRQTDVEAIRQTMNELVLGSEVMGYVRLQNQAIHDDLEQMRATLQQIARSPLLRLGR